MAKSDKTYPVRRHTSWSELPHLHRADGDCLTLSKFVKVEAHKRNRTIQLFVCDGVYVVELSDWHVSKFRFASLTTETRPSPALLKQFAKYNFKDAEIGEPAPVSAPRKQN